MIITGTDSPIENRKPHLHHIKLEGYKSIQRLDLAMNPINILIGANGSGKSNFISLFSFLRNLSEGKLQTYVEKNGFANTFFYFGSKTTKRITIEIDVGNNGYHAELVHGEANDTLVFEDEYCTVYSSSKKWKVKGRQGESGLLPDGEADSGYVKKYTREYLEKCRVYHFHDTSPTAAFKQAQKISSSIYLQSDAGNLAPFLLYLKNHCQDSYQEIIAAIRTVAPFFHDFYLVPRGEKGDESLLLRWIHKGHDAPFSANQLSDGTARFICMATLFLQPEWSRPDTIILDEPELGLHPAALEVLAEVIKSVSRKTQVICSTQSVTFANHFEPEDFIVVDQNNGASSFARLKRSDLENWLESYGMGDIWSKNLIGGRPEW
jgi:predicted ATPase